MISYSLIRDLEINLQKTGYVSLIKAFEKQTNNKLKYLRHIIIARNKKHTGRYIKTEVSIDCRLTYKMSF